MQYNITINQLAISNDLDASRVGVDIVDAAILEYLYHLCSSVNEKIDAQRVRHDEKTWTWINYGSLLDEMPLLGIKSKGALSVRFQKLVDAGYISLYRQSHQKMYVRLQEKVDELFTKTNRAVHENEQLPAQKLFTKTNTTLILTNHNTNNASNRERAYRKRLPIDKSKIGDQPRAADVIDVKSPWQAKAKYVAEKLSSPSSQATSILRVCKVYPEHQVDLALQHAADATVEDRTGLFFKSLASMTSPK